jgi:hypothetical protein
MSDTTLVDLASTVDTHLAGYCEPDPDHRLELLQAAWAPTGRLIDPPFDGTGPGGVAEMVDAVLGHYPAHTFRRTTVVDAHHDRARYGWELVAPDGTVAVAGTDVVTVDADGRIVEIVGFFGDLAPAE